MNITSLGEMKVEKKSFKQIEQKLEQLNHPKWISLNEFQKQLQLSDLLMKCIQEEPEGFVLRHVADFIERVLSKNLCDQYSILIFESFLNHYLKISNDENLKIRGKIAGKEIPRTEYQTLFPIGMDKYYEGPHFVTAHSSPDIDTTVASFWGWLDAFASRVSLGSHIWNVPGGPPRGSIEKEILFSAVFGHDFFKNFSKDKTTLSVTAFDLYTKKGLKMVHPEALLTDMEEGQEALIVTHDDGVYLSDWKEFDSENFRRITSSIFSVLRSFDARFQHLAIQTFSKVELTQKVAEEAISQMLNSKIEEDDAFIELSMKFKNQIHLFLVNVLTLKEGVHASFIELFKAINRQAKKGDQVDLSQFSKFYAKGLFDQTGQLIDRRSKILETIDAAFQASKDLMELSRKVFASFRFAVATKESVFSHLDQSISALSDLEEVKTRIGNHPFITVNLHHDESVKLPLGVIYAHELQKPILGTVTCRDFTNRDETKIPSYLEIISGLDHHKMQLNSTAPITLKIMDVQSANTLVALEAFQINDRYSFGAISPKEIDRLIAEEKLDSPSSMRLMQRLIQRKMNMRKSPTSLIDVEREILEYYHFIFAILDDTDLLSKVTRIDLECMASLVNRLKSLQLKKEVEVIHFDDLTLQEPQFLKMAASRLLQNPELYSLYKTVYQQREKAVVEQIDQILKHPTFPLFEDTKIQNGCARVGQKKLYSSNIQSFQKQKQKVIELWVKESEGVFEKNRDIDLHMLMISTIASSEDVFKGSKIVYSHQDELWFYIPSKESAISHLKLFLTQFQRNKMIAKYEKSLKVTIFGKNAHELKICFEESFLPCEIHTQIGIDGLVILSHEAGILNSRKSMISPFLPVN